MNVHLYLDKPQLEKSVVMLNLAFDGYRVKVSARKSVDTKLWDSRHECIKRSATHCSELNSYLSNLKSFATNVYYEKKAIGEKVTRDYIKTKLKQFFSNPNIDRNSPDFVTLYMNFIDERVESKIYKPSTISSYRIALKHLRDFLKVKNKKLYLEDIGIEFYNEFVRYLTVDLEMMENTWNGIIKPLKTFMNDALRKGLTSNTRFANEIKTYVKEGDSVALTEEDLGKLEKSQMPSRFLKDIKNLFLILVYTGMRISDLKNSKNENIDMNNGIITVNTLKTSEKVLIPIHSRLREILMEYELEGLPKNSIKYINRAIKKVGRIAGIDEPIEIVRNYGARRVEETKPKYEMLSSHTGRRTFITLSLKRGALPEDVMKISGHKNRDCFQKYVRISQNEPLNNIRNIWEK